ncbi:hypothetical protein PFFVO_01244 [Plasmodium falciparum Vietnam Oak-Knoll (FVO)]|uniref:Surface antigen n=1 Tax=Plasmodium falciparum Vietnam Oak-Knoll (FVO) TaxID=1036723 RepID=A0A024VA12_PLAFA|nr:hypothetical protein PFFVO_01244 [Plasmodium falciparum Vietnam Oak-Knoll (FVO)]
MKAVMENYNRQTSDRFKEYDERMKTTRQKCKDKYDKEIQNIILKDKLEKELMDKFATLHTDMQSDAIPTCVCEKSMADKTEKFCLNCSKNMGAIAPWWGLVCGTGYAGWSHYVPFAISKAAMDAGMNVVSFGLETLGAEKLTAVILKEISSINDFSKVTTFAKIIQSHFEASCAAMPWSTSDGTVRASMCMLVKNGRERVVSAEQLVSRGLNQIVEKAPQAANFKTVEVTTTYKSITSTLTNTIIASIIAIVIIVLIMVIIYLILRYRRKKKMKKKLQYIKLLEE